MITRRRGTNAWLAIGVAVSGSLLVVALVERMPAAALPRAAVVGAGHLVSDRATLPTTPVTTVTLPPAPATTDLSTTVVTAVPKVRTENDATADEQEQDETSTTKPGGPGPVGDS